ncbi:helix-turn-helix transcriptional regulator [Paenibacillus tarimensis]
MKQLKVGSNPRWNEMVSRRLNDFPLYIQNDRCTAPKLKPPHLQPGAEIHITHEGEALFAVRGALIKQSHRHVTIVRDKVPHQLIIDPRAEYRRTVVCVDTRGITGDGKGLTALLDKDWLPERDWDSFVLSPPVYGELVAICERIVSEQQESKPGWGRKVLALFLDLTVLLERNGEPQGDGSEADCRDPMPALVQACVHYIHGHIHENLSLNAVADRFGVSPEYVTRSFRKEIHMSYYQYVLLQRVLRAKEYMHQFSDLNLTAIALSTGFSSSSHFCRVFRNVAGESPSAFRKRNLFPGQ